MSAIGMFRQSSIGPSFLTPGCGKLCVWQRNEQKPIKHSEKLIYSTRSRPTVHHRIRGKHHARTSTKRLCESSKKLLKRIKPLANQPHRPPVLRRILVRCAQSPDQQL
jgi:hypothetical protein